MPLDLISRTDPLLANVAPKHFDAFDPARVARHLAPGLVKMHGQAKLFIADSLLKVWADSFTPITGDKRLGRPHLLNRDRFLAVVFALEEYSPKQIAGAVRAYARHCRENPERKKKPEMRKTFEAFLKDILETWAAVENQQAASVNREQQQVADLREHREFMTSWSQLSPARQTQLLRQAGSTFTGANPTTSNPAFRAVLQKLMQDSSQLSAVGPQPEASGRMPAANAGPSSPSSPSRPSEAEEVLAAWDSMSKSDQAQLLERAEKRLLAQGRYAGRRSMAVPVLRNKVYDIIRQQLRQQAEEGFTTETQRPQRREVAHR
jgi:hypothetical protein